MKFEKEATEMRGAFSAIFTPFHQDGSLNLPMLSQIVEFQLKNGIRGFFVAGSTGEGLLMSSKERTEVVRHMAENFGNRATIIAHVGHANTRESAELARQSAEAGAHWIASVTPIYHGKTFESTLRHYDTVSNATNLPFMIYSLDGVIDSKRDAQFFQLPNVCGLKYTGGNFFSVQQLMRNVDRPVAYMSGFDEQFVAGQSFGFNGGIGSTYNFGPQFYSGIFENYHAGNIEEAARLQAAINRVTDLMIEYENWSYRKAIMKFLGFDCGPCREPYAPITETEYDAFAKRLDQLSVLSPASTQS